MHCAGADGSTRAQIGAPAMWKWTSVSIPIGSVTSGSLGPTVGQNIGLAYVPLAQAEPGTLLSIDCRGKRAAARVVKPTFYKRPRP